MMYNVIVTTKNNIEVSANSPEEAIEQLKAGIDPRTLEMTEFIVATEIVINENKNDKENKNAKRK